MPSPRRLAIALVIALLASPAGLAQEAEPAPVREDPRVQRALAAYEVWLEAQRAHGRMPGVSAAIVHDQELVWSGGLGYADIAAARPADASTLYSICSISKLFTSVAVMQQRDAGEFTLDTEVAEILPWFEIREEHADSGRATVEGILTHSAGLPRESAHPYWTGPEFPFPSRDEVIRDVSSQETLYPTATYFQYSNLGMTLAGEIVTATSGMPFGDYIRDRILTPLGMDSTYPEIPVALAGSRFATGYSPLPRGGEREPMAPFQAHAIAPAAGFASSVEDLARFASWQMRLLDNGGTEVLDANTLREMHRVHWVDNDWSVHWGLGFSVQRWNDRTIVRHGGSCPGFRSEFSLAPADRLAAIAAVNAMGVSPGVMTRAAMDLVGPAIQAAVDSPGEGTISDPGLSDYVGVYRSAWGEEAIVLWDDSIASIPLPSDRPRAGLTELVHVEGDTFRRKRGDGELGEEWIFHRDAAGSVARLSQHGNFAEKVE
jgi:CubicO group peptidase (beta-lactamase class C family)